MLPGNFLRPIEIVFSNRQSDYGAGECQYDVRMVLEVLS